MKLVTNRHFTKETARRPDEILEVGDQFMVAEQRFHPDDVYGNITKYWDEYTEKVSYPPNTLFALGGSEFSFKHVYWRKVNFTMVVPYETVFILMAIRPETIGYNGGYLTYNQYFCISLQVPNMRFVFHFSGGINGSIGQVLLLEESDIEPYYAKQQFLDENRQHISVSIFDTPYDD